MQPSHDQSTNRRVTVVEAAALLGVTPDAVRSRLRRGTLQRDEAEDGTVLVILNGDRHDASETDRATHQTTVDYINALKSHIETLEGEVDAWREEARRKDHLLAAALERIPAIEEASLEPRDAPVSASEERGSVDCISGDREVLRAPLQLVEEGVRGVATYLGDLTPLQRRADLLMA
jgi:hypothetical protein